MNLLGQFITGVKSQDSSKDESSSERSRSESISTVASEFESADEAEEKMETQDSEYSSQLDFITKDWTKLDENEDFAMYKCNGRQLVQLDLELGEKQRALKTEQVRKIKDELGSMFYHNFIIVNNTVKKELRLYDGNHRLKALSMCSEIKQKTVSCYVLVYVVRTDDELFLKELFDKINTIRGTTEEEQVVRETADDITKAIIEGFGFYRKGDGYIIPDKSREKVGQHNKWRIGGITLKQEIEARFNRLKHYTSQQIVDKLKECNQKRLENKQDFYTKSKVRSQALIEKMEKFKFMIGIDFPHVLNEII